MNPEPYGKKNPFPSLLKKRSLLTQQGSAKETIHLELDLEGSGFSYEPGDALAVIPQNCPEYIDYFLKQTGFDPNIEIELKNIGKKTLRQAFLSHLDITGLSKPLLTKYNALAQSDKLAQIIENKEALSDYIWARQLVDLLEEFPIQNLQPQELVNMLRKLLLRLYSIASSLKAHPNEVHLTVGVVRYDFKGSSRKGVCSTYMAEQERVDLGDTMPIFVHHNKNFKLPEDNALPIIMIGPGTGIAPFRAFIEERASTGASGKNWLFFGDQHEATDFLYEKECAEYQKKGILTRLDTAFSRDQEHKIYVQHRMLENAKEIYAWLEEGAYFYVCGDASRMAGDVHNALLEIIQKEGVKSSEEAEAYLSELKKAKRYQRDVY